MQKVRGSQWQCTSQGNMVEHREVILIILSISASARDIESRKVHQRPFHRVLSHHSPCQFTGA